MSLPGFHRRHDRCLFLAAIFFVTLSSLARGQSVPTYYVEGVCAEYLTAPAATNYIAHFSYLEIDTSNSFSGGFFLRPGIPQNYFAPGNPSVGQVSTFYPGYHFDIQNYFSSLSGKEAWTLLGSSGTVYPLGVTGTSPTCKPTFIPSPLTYSSVGTYTHQYLGQVSSGPPANPDRTVTLVALPFTAGVSVTNLTYVPNDTTLSTGSNNPNSIYGDVTVSATGGPLYVGIQLLLNNVVTVDGTLTITP